MTLFTLLTRRPRQETAVPETRTAPAWPEGVIARYLTVGGATVDLTPGVKDHVAHRCTGCGKGSSAFGNFEVNAREYAQSHAEVCRALPKPEGV
jgi:hypothetical protein